MMRRFWDAVEAWMDDENGLIAMFKFFAVFGSLFALVMVLIILLCTRSDNSAEHRCLASGGGWAIIGSHYATTMMMSGKIMVPMTQQVTDYGCVTVTRHE